MRTHQSYNRRSRLPSLLIGGFVLSLLVGGGLLTTLWLLGVNLNPFSTVAPEDPFMVRIPINAKPIPAYTRVDRTQMINPATGGLMFQKIPPEAVVGMSLTGVDSQGTPVDGRVEAIKRDGDQVVFIVDGNREVPQSQTSELGGALINVNAIIGRVVKRDKRAGLGFQESTFFPVGTPAGIAGATPEGMRAMTLDATRLTGVHALSAGDQIDLMASLSPDSADAKNQGKTGNSSNRGGDVQPVMLAQNALVLKPVYVRGEASSSASLTQGTRIQNVPKYEVAIAVHPDDIIPLQTAINGAEPITCIVHSMQPAKGDEPVALVNRGDAVEVPITVRPIYAYDVISRDAFVSPATRTVKTESMSRQQVQRLGIITSLDEIFGAIARQDIPAGHYLRHSDLLSGPPAEPPATARSGATLDAATRTAPKTFVSDASQPAAKSDMSWASAVQPPESPAGRLLPGQSLPTATVVGDRPAITRFIPPGRTAVAIPWNRFYAAEHLQIGDRVDLLVGYSLQRNESIEETETRPDGTVIVRRSDSLAPRQTERTWDETFGFRGESWFVASDAVVIGPVGFPPPASALRALQNSNGRSSNSSSGQPDGPSIIIAVDQRDVEAVTTALSTAETMFSVNFRPEDPSAVASGTMRIVVTSQPLLPYQAFRDQDWNGNRREPASRVVAIDDPRFADAITIDRIDAYYGRVCGRHKARGEHLTEADFLPVGTTAGLAAGARPGHSMFVIADREIEGLDSFETDDRIAILVRGMTDTGIDLSAVGIEPKRTVAEVVVQSVRIARRSTAGQTVLEVADESLGPLQAAIARSEGDRDRDEDRTQLVAIVRPRGQSEPTTSAAGTDSEGSGEIPSYDPLAEVEYTEVIRGRERTKHAYLGRSR